MPGDSGLIQTLKIGALIAVVTLDVLFFFNVLSLQEQINIIAGT